MIKIVIVLAVSLVVAGCASTTASHTVLPSPAGYYSVGDSSLAPQDARAITVAHQYVEKKIGKKAEAYYCPRKKDTGYVVDAFRSEPDFRRLALEIEDSSGARGGTG